MNVTFFADEQFERGNAKVVFNTNTALRLGSVLFSG
jgi:hypothetical protein